jgi:subtilisin family serine protease
MTQVRFVDARLGGTNATGRGVLVGVVDSGWDRSHDHHRILRGAGFVEHGGEQLANLSDDDSDRLGHGTASAGVVLDVAPDCRIVPLRVFADRLDTSPGIVAEALEYALNRGIRVLNLSLGTTEDAAVPVLYSACERARQAGIILVSAARQSGRSWSYPAVFDPVIGVGAANLQSLTMIRFSQGAAVECSVRTSNRIVLGLRRRLLVSQGTSHAAPVVTGLIARWLEDDPTLDVDGVRRRFLHAW